MVDTMTSHIQDAYRYASFIPNGSGVMYMSTETSNTMSRNIIWIDECVQKDKEWDDEENNI